MVGQNTRYGSVLSMNLSPDPAPPLRELREVVRTVLAQEDQDCVSNVELLLTELVSNAYDHGRAPRSLQVERLSSPSVVRIEVADASRHDLPVVGVSRLSSVRGRGLLLVNALAHRWGVSLHQAGKTVWAEVACQALGTGRDPAF
jgi:anti-sigma regulatory factor (Ser/Thr protein kinase)